MLGQPAYRLADRTAGPQGGRVHANPPRELSNPMPDRANTPLLTADDPKPVIRDENTCGASPFLLIGDHAGRAIPRALGDLGLPPAERERHIAVDIGIEELGLALARKLGAPFLRQAYSRLVIDCNRSPDHPGSVAEASDGTHVPGNASIGAERRRARVEEIFTPYQDAIAKALDARAAAGLPTILVSLHSFTPSMDGRDRPWELGVLHNGHEDGFSLAVLERLRGHGEFTIGDNEPYRMNETDYTVPRHAFPRGLPYLELEVRQDLIGQPGGRVEEIAELLAQTLATCA